MKNQNEYSMKEKRDIVEVDKQHTLVEELMQPVD
jgi:hypothetical protein